MNIERRKKEIKKNLIIVLVAITSILIGVLGSYFIFNNSNKLEVRYENPLPKQEKSEGLRGVYDIDKNINEKTIDNYLDRSDTVYRDVRMLMDSATWENKGGERELTGFVDGFEFFESIKEKYGDYYNLYTFETWYNEENAKLIYSFAESMGDKVTGVPYTIIGDK